MNHKTKLITLSLVGFLLINNAQGMDDRSLTKKERELYEASSCGDLERVKSLLTHAADPKELVNAGIGTPNGPAILMASKSGYPSVAQVLIEAGADVNGANQHGLDSLELAARRGDIEMVSFLLEKGATNTKAAMVAAAKNITIRPLSAMQKVKKGISPGRATKGPNLDVLSQNRLLIVKKLYSRNIPLPCPEELKGAPAATIDLIQNL